MNEERVLGRLLSQEELQTVSGGDDGTVVVLPPVTTTPTGDCIAEEDGTVTCPE